MLKKIRNLKEKIRNLKELLLVPIANLLIRLIGPYVKRDERLMLFGTNSNQFKDNTKYFFLYMSGKNNYRSYWVSESKMIVENLRRLGLKAVHSSSYKLIFLVMKAKFIFVVSGIGNICKYSIGNNAIIINLWHGTPIKKIWFDCINKDKEYYKYWKSEIESWNYFIVPNRNLISMFQKAGNIKQNKILITGLPRNDILFKAKNNPYIARSIRKKVTSTYGINNQSKIILYCPTHRDRIENYKIKEVEQTILDFKAKYYKEDIVLLVRFHPLRCPTLRPEIIDNNKVLDVFNYDDTQELLIAADILITDYSSIVFDYAILERPIYLFLYDFDEYYKSRDGFNYDMKSLPFKICLTKDDLLNEIRKNNNFNKVSYRNLANKFNKESASENLFNTIQSL